MAEFAITGGIGSGKSTVSAALEIRGAKLVDADEVVRELQRPNGEVFTNLVQEFGEVIINEDGELNRQKLADIAFSDPVNLEKLNKIVHPAVGKEMAKRRNAFISQGHIVLVDIPLLVTPEGSLARKEYKDFTGKIVIDCDEKIAVSRLVQFRGFREDDAWARIDKQASREQRLEFADFVIDNNGDSDSLELQIDLCWAWMTSLDSEE
ncbi:MAG: dephospho-CoA kinase [Acidimicrobiaceae bacterium]|nr:dephospho-CoA kinase [Acidimicrobiaceae bacterium]